MTRHIYINIYIFRWTGIHALHEDKNTIEQALNTGHRALCQASIFGKSRLPICFNSVSAAFVSAAGVLSNRPAAGQHTLQLLEMASSQSPTRPCCVRRALGARSQRTSRAVCFGVGARRYKAWTGGFVAVQSDTWTSCVFSSSARGRRSAFSRTREQPAQATCSTRTASPR